MPPVSSQTNIAAIAVACAGGPGELSDSGSYNVSFGSGHKKLVSDERYIGGLPGLEGSFSVLASHTPISS